MGTITDKLSYLLETKTLIREAIELKNVNVPNNTTFRQYADLIKNITPNLQDKEITIQFSTQQTQEVIADDGYDGLSKIIINIPTIEDAEGMYF